jgi:D-alanyl-D-alanine carboxypeptidase (penicillin-binding protein 5/6)
MRSVAHRALAPLLAALVAVLPLGPAAAAGSPSAPPPAIVGGPPPAVTADAAVLLDARTGRILWGRNAQQARAPASTTKMMTALVALELGHPDDVVTVTPQAAGTPGSSARLRTGDRYTLGNLLLALMLRSGNDAAVAIAVHLAGSVPAFVALMNRRAQQLGLEQTHFVNPHGLTAPRHQSSALDLARIARAGLGIPAFAALVATADAEIQGRDALEREIRRELHNTNRLLLTYDWVDGVKTGTTAAAGNCLVASGSRGGMRLIAVVLHSDDRWGDAVRLLQWGFLHFSPYRAAADGSVWATLPVTGATDPRARLRVLTDGTLAAPVALGELPYVRVRAALPRTVPAPVRLGQRLGTAYLQVGTGTLAEVPLVAGASIARAGLLRRLLRAIVDLL